MIWAVSQLSVISLPCCCCQSREHPPSFSPIIPILLQLNVQSRHAPWLTYPPALTCTKTWLQHFLHYFSEWPSFIGYWRKFSDLFVYLNFLNAFSMFLHIFVFTTLSFFIPCPCPVRNSHIPQLPCTSSQETSTLLLCFLLNWSHIGVGGKFMLEPNSSSCDEAMNSDKRWTFNEAREGVSEREGKEKY